MSKDEFVLTWNAARDLVQSVEDAFGAADLATIATGFTEDAVARFADFPEMRGRPAIMTFLTARFARTLSYKLTKRLQVLSGNRLANTWDASWTDAQTGKKMLGRGTEIWILRGRQIVVWDATFNVWEKVDRPPRRWCDDDRGDQPDAAPRHHRPARFRRHWLNVHGPLVCAFPGLRRYVQCHVIDSLAANEAGLMMRIDGFPILYFDNDADRSRAHGSPEMAACNVDSRQFVGAVARVMTEVSGALRHDRGRFSLIEIWPEAVTPRGGRYYHVREQGAAPNSTIPHLPITAGAITQTWYGSLVELECAADDIEDTPAARFAVEEHWLI